MKTKPFAEHDIVFLTKWKIHRQDGPGIVIPAHTVGTIVHLYSSSQKAKRCLVEFQNFTDLEGSQILNCVTEVPFASLRHEATCVYCGCTDSHACAGGCQWVELHQHTPTGVCSHCTASIKGLKRMDVGGYILINPGAKGPAHIWFERRRGEGMDIEECKLVAVLRDLFKREF